MEEKQNIRLHPLDLSKRGHKLEEVFSSVINLIPDLSLPSSYRWSGENDFFDHSKQIKLVPFSKQLMFETGLNLESGVDHDSEGELFSRQFTSPRVSPIQKHNCNQLQREREKSKTSQQGAAEMRKKRLELRARLFRRYSRLKIRNSAQKDDHRHGYDRIFKEKDSGEIFANPMPDCMLTTENIDNLRNIIVASQAIEWRMLTPVRPTSEYEEQYFDQLIKLHRSRYKSRLESTYEHSNRTGSPFRHSRTPFLLHYSRSKPKSTQSLHSAVSLSLGLTVRGKFRGREERAKSIIRMQTPIPTLTLTADDQIDISEPIVSKVGDDLDEGPRDNEEGDNDHNEFNYEYFSRFSRRNVSDSGSSFVAVQIEEATSEIRGAGRRRRRCSSWSPQVRQAKQVAERPSNEKNVEEIISRLMESAANI